MAEISIDRLYKGIEQAETGHLNPGMDRYIRTTKKDSGSSAFGPVQMTKGILSGPGYLDIGFTEEEDSFIQNVFIPQANKFLKYGGKDMVEGMERFDYGGPGDFTPADTSMYKQVAKKLMTFEFNRADKDVDTFIQNWRGATEEEDPRYYKEVRKVLSADNQVFDAMVDSTSTTALDTIKKELNK